MYRIEQSKSPSIKRALRRSLQEPLTKLSSLGFEELGVCQEKYSLFMPIVAPLIPLMMFVRGECLRLRFPFSLTQHTLMLVSSDGVTLALLYKLQCEFYSFFDDGTAVITSTVQHQPKAEDHPIHRAHCDGELSEMWKAHQHECEWWLTQGARKHERVAFELFRCTARQEMSLADWFQVAFSCWAPIVALVYLFKWLSAI